MSFENFKATIWSKSIDKDLSRVCVFAADTNQKYQGEINKRGDTVRLLGVGKPTINTFGNKERITLDGPEHVEDTSVSIVADHVATFNYGVEDVDRAQGADGVMSVLNTESSEQCSNEIDKFIADMSLKKEAWKLKNGANSFKVVSGVAGEGEINVLELLDMALEKLYENDVTPSTTITATVPPWFYTLFKQAYIKADTDNSDMLENGRVAKYANMIIRLSNNVAKSGDDSFIQVKTQRAIGLVKSSAHTEAYRPENGFEDAVKGFVIYGGAIVRPKELINIVCQKAQ